MSRRGKGGSEKAFVKYAKKDIGGLQLNKVNKFRIYFSMKQDSP